MPVEFYVQNPDLHIQNERHAICYVARQLYQRYRQSSKHYILVANIDPTINADMQKTEKITQLEAILIGEHSISILEFKNYFDPIIAKSLHGYWYTKNDNHSEKVRGGSKKNPFLQGRHARGVWRAYMQQKCKASFNKSQSKPLTNALNYISYFLLFHPYLHKDSQFPKLGSASKWFYIRGIRAILELTYAVVNEKIVELSPEMMHNLATKVLCAKPWPDIDKLLHTKIGYLYVLEPDKMPVRYPLSSFQEFSLGRSSSIEGHQINGKHDLVSANHAQIITDQNQVYIQDLGSTNGTYLNNTKITGTTPVPVTPSEKIYLGSRSHEGVKLWYTKTPTHTTQDPKVITRVTKEK